VETSDLRLRPAARRDINGMSIRRALGSDRGLGDGRGPDGASPPPGGPRHPRRDHVPRRATGPRRWASIPCISPPHLADGSDQLLMSCAVAVSVS